MNAIEKRIKAQEEGAQMKTNGMINAYFKNGETCVVFPGEAIVLSLMEADTIDHFEGLGYRKGGIIEVLVNSLLPGKGKDGNE